MESSDEDFLTKFDRPDDGIIMAEFPDSMLTSEIRTQITNCLCYMEQLHSSAAAALTKMKNRTIGPWLIWEIHEIRRIS